MFNPRGVFFDNPVAKMDMRVQMRGNRPMIVWVLYLGMLVLIASIAYAGVAGGGVRSAAVVQQSLLGFNWSVMVTLSALVLLTAPALTAATIATEKQRRSLELVFSTPASPTLYAWGKLLSAYRTVWVLLVLAIPIAAVGYVMGGGTWLDILASFMIVSYNGLLLCAAAMAAASVSSNPISAVVIAYVLSGLIQLGLTLISGVSLAPMIYGGMGNVNPLGALNAFFAVAFAPAHTTMFGVSVPAFIPAGVIVFLISLVMVMGASSGMTRFGSPETKVFRSVLLGVSALIGMWCATDTAMGGNVFSAVLIPLAVVIGLLLPVYGSFETYGDQKFRDDGPFNFRRLFIGCPSSALPFTLVMVGLIVLPSAIRFGYSDLVSGTTSTSFGMGSAAFAGPNVTAHVLPTVYLFVLITFLWAMCRTVSRLTAVLSGARVLGIARFIGIAVAP